MSGGADSLALMVLVAAWCKKRRLPQPHALTVDHGLRAGSALEASRVAAWARTRAIAHETLIWTGHKPSQNIQARAREARYRLLGDWMRAHSIGVLLTGHTLDDQAETFMLRLARGSGLDGLSGMANVAPFPLSGFDDLKIARPLLGFAHDRLTATLTQLGQPWIEDPSNENDRFARVQVRRALSAFAEIGLTNTRIASAAAHLRRAREAIDEGVATLIANGVELSPWGYGLAKSERFADAPREVALRALSRLIEAVGGGDFPPRFEQIEQALDWLTAPNAKLKGCTLGGCRLARRDATLVLIAREESALAKQNPVLRLKPGETGIWDGRFEAELAYGAAQGFCEVRRLGPSGLKRLGPKAPLPPVEPHRIAAAAPALWQGERLIAAPLAGLNPPEPAFSVRFTALTRLTVR
ncbi:MAG: tRNA lysidine(34) synthetase TilS [Micropepsaceae bacterium]